MKRSRMVSFRLSPDEYETLLGLSRSVGARSISDLARLSMQRLAKDHQSASSLTTRVDDLYTRVAELEKLLTERQGA